MMERDREEGKDWGEASERGNEVKREEIKGWKRAEGRVGKVKWRGSERVKETINEERRKQRICRDNEGKQKAKGARKGSRE